MNNANIYAVQNQITGQITKCDINDAARLAQLNGANIKWAIEEYGECTADEWRITEWDDGGLDADIDLTEDTSMNNANNANLSNATLAAARAALMETEERIRETYPDVACDGTPADLAELEAEHKATLAAIAELNATLAPNA